MRCYPRYLISVVFLFLNSLAGSAPAQTLPSKEGEWFIPGKDYAGTRYSRLEEINSSNVKNLKSAWSFSTGVNRGQEAAPLIVGDTMYIVTPYPNYLYALDLKNSGAIKWKYEPKPSSSSQGVACCDVVNRGASYSDGRIFFNTLDDQTVSVDAGTGKELWRTKLGEINHGETITMAPLVAKNKVLVGNSGGEYGVRGWIQALDKETGKVLWKAYNTGPDSEVLISKDKFKPFYPQDRGEDLGVKTWPLEQWKMGGGTVWGWITYDPETNSIYHGTGNPGPWNPDQRPGDNKWTAGIFSRDLDTGQAKWFYQFSPHDLHDYDAINESIVADLNINGSQRKVLIHPERNGYVYVIDRVTGEVLSADAFAFINSSKGVDLKTGQLLYNDEKKPQMGKVVSNICPASPGAKDWNPSAFSLKNNILYIPHNNLCEDAEGIEANYISGTPYVGMNTKMYAGPGGHRGEFTAWDPVQKKEIWKIKEYFPIWSGALVTAGDVVFYGTMEGYFKAVNAKTGELLWQYKTGSGIIGQPVTYTGPDNKQYVAILSGVGGWSGAIVAGDLVSDDPTAALGFVNAMKDLAKYSAKGGTLYVFSLP
jgi:PQQ-dependent dehydrogenase (methanol/ethanol family)